MAVQAVSLLLYSPSAQVVQVLSWVWPGTTVNFSVLPHVVLLAVHAVLLLVYSPSAHGVQVVSSLVCSLLDPALNFWPLPHEVRFLLHVLHPFE